MVLKAKPRGRDLHYISLICGSVWNMCVVGTRLHPRDHKRKKKANKFPREVVRRCETLLSRASKLSLTHSVCGEHAVPRDSIISKSMQFAAGDFSRHALVYKALAFSELFSSEFYSLLSIPCLELRECPLPLIGLTDLLSLAAKLMSVLAGPLAKKVTDKRKEEGGARSRAHKDGWRFLLLRPQALAVSLW